MAEWTKEVFAKNLRYYLSQSGKTQKEVAGVIGVSAPTFHEWCSAKKTPRMDKVEKLANYFGILKSDLIEDKSKHSKDVFPLYKDISNTALSHYELRIIEMLNKLNSEGQQKAEAYIKDLLGNPSYNKELKKHEYTLADYGQIAAEGGEGSREPNVEEFDIL